MRKRVLIVVPTLGIGGGEKLAIDIVLNLDVQKYEVLLLSLFPKMGTEFESIIKKNNINIQFLNKKLGFDPKVILAFANVVRKYKPHTIHTHLNVVPYVLPATILYGIKNRFHTVHSVASMESTGFLKKIMKITYRFFSFTPVAICDVVKTTICEEYDLPDEKVPCIYNGVNTEIYKKLERKQNTNYINFITTGRMQHVKNHNLMINAFSDVAKKYDNVMLTILGDGELRLDIEKQIKELGLEEKVILKGVVSNVAEELNKADVYIMTSNYEGLPLSVLEAMASGLPIVTTKAGGVIDIVKQNQNGLLVDVGNREQLTKEMSKLVEDVMLRQRFGEVSFNMSKQYDIQKCVEKYESLYLSSKDNRLCWY
ncbi:glycosyltransferase [Lysinibacillus sp. NPDC094177]|uniref:glycosyltransferase n=1 Tax=Lysinibacillus sp. NPDC094177 TaxID=3390580 RepID=UPI003D03EEB9